MAGVVGLAWYVRRVLASGRSERSARLRRYTLCAAGVLGLLAIAVGAGISA